MQTEYCKILIQKSQQFQPTYAKGKLAIHLPMSLIALDKMGASEKQLNLFYQNSIIRLDIRKKNTQTKINNIEDALGQKEFFESYVVFFENELKNISMKSVLANSLPVLIKGISASAFHPVIRLSYALDIDNETEIILSLASWATEYLSFENSFDLSSKNLNNILLEFNIFLKNHYF